MVCALCASLASPHGNILSFNTEHTRLLLSPSRLFLTSGPRMFFHTFRKPDSLLPPYTLSEPHFHPLVALCPPQLCICEYFTTVCHSVSWGSCSPVFLNIQYGACHLADAQRTLSMYSYESWTVKEEDCQRTDAFEPWSGEDSWKSLGLQGDQTS